MSIFGGFPILTHMEVPGYAGNWRLNLFLMECGTNLPPKKWCEPENLLAHNFGAVRETYIREILLVR